MRNAALVLLSLAAAHWSCGVECGSPAAANGTYAMFANPITYQATNEADFPSYMTPANGWTEWDIRWNTLDTSQVAVEIDGQPYAGRGSWDDVECGNFDLAFEGRYESTNESIHDFEMDGQFVLFGGRIEGSWSWSESWTNKYGDTGTFTTVGQVSGNQPG